MTSNFKDDFNLTDMTTDYNHLDHIGMVSKCGNRTCRVH